MADTGNVLNPAPVTRTVTCDSDLSAKYGYAVNLDTTDDDNVDLASAATAVPFPVYEGADGSSAKAAMTIVVAGCAEVKAGGTIAPGDKLTSDGNGKWITTTTDTNNYGAIALKIAAADDLIPVLVVQGMIAG